MRHILGLALRDHDSAACLLSEGRVVAAAKEERFSRKPHDGAMPAQAIRFCLESAGLAPDRIDAVVVGHKPLLRFESLLPSYLHAWPGEPRFFRDSLTAWLGRGLHLRGALRALGFAGPIAFVRHHEAHAADAFFSSPFETAAVVVADGVGEGASVSLGAGARGALRLSSELRFPDSLGLFYGAFADYLGYGGADGEERVMALSRSGRPAFAQAITERVLSLQEDGSFAVDPGFFPRPGRLDERRARGLFGTPRREPGGDWTGGHADLAASVQDVFEAAMERVCRHALSEAGATDLCLSGGAARNRFCNERLLRETCGRLHVPAECGSAGTALGAALFYWHSVLAMPRGAPRPGPVFLGPAFDDTEIERYLRRAGIAHERIAPEALAGRAASFLAERKTLGWFQGRMEFGRDALGNRSVLGVPGGTWAGEARLCTRAAVDPESNPLFHRLLEAAEQRAMPELLHAPLQIPGAPLACTPQNAYQCYRVMRLDALFLGGFLVAPRADHKRL